MAAFQLPQLDRRLASQGFRFGGYAFWTALAIGGPLAIDRLLICPKLNAQFGEEVFGGFVWVRAIGFLLGGIISGGLSLFLMRDIATKTADEIPGTIRTAITLTLIVSLLGCVLGGGISYLVAPEIVQDLATVLYLPVLCCTMLANTELILGVRLRMQRAFRALCLLRLIQIAVLLIYAFLVLNSNLWVMGGAFVLSALLPLAAAFYINRKDLLKENVWWDRSAIRWLIKGWMAGTAPVTLDSLSRYAPPLLIGVLIGDAAMVTVFFAGTSIANIFATPALVLSNVIQSLLASKQTFIVHGNRSRYYFIVCVFLGLFAGITSYYLGLWIIETLYPLIANKTAEFYHWLAIATGFQFFRTMLRPVVIKYIALKTYAVAPAINAFVKLAAFAILVPWLGLYGGAIALLLSESITAIVVCLLYYSADIVHTA